MISTLLFFSKHFLLLTLTFRFMNNFELLMLWGKGQVSVLCLWMCIDSTPFGKRQSFSLCWKSMDHEHGFLSIFLGVLSFPSAVSYIFIFYSVQIYTYFVLFPPYILFCLSRVLSPFDFHFQLCGTTPWGLLLQEDSSQ